MHLYGKKGLGLEEMEKLANATSLEKITGDIQQAWYTNHSEDLSKFLSRMCSFSFMRNTPKQSYWNWSGLGVDFRL